MEKGASNVFPAIPNTPKHLLASAYVSPAALVRKTLAISSPEHRKSSLILVRNSKRRTKVEFLSDHSPDLLDET